MNIRLGFIISLVIAGCAFAYSLYIGGSLPDVVPTHWNAAGKVDAYGSKATGMYMIPAMMVGLALMMIALPKLSPRKFEVTTFESAYATIFVILSAMFFAIHVVILRATAGHNADITKTMFAVMFLFFALMGNWMGKVRQNFYMGIRTPWTLADERVWDATHRAAGRIWFVGGIVGAIIAIVAPFGVSIAVLLAMTLYPVVLSYIIYRRIAA